MTVGSQEILKRRLLDAGLVKREDLERCAEIAAGNSRSLGETLADRIPVDERELFRQIAATYELVLWEVEDLFGAIDPEIAARVPRRYQERKRVIPIQARDGVLSVATPDPGARTLDLGDAFELERVELRLVTPSDFRRLRWALDLGQLPAGPAADEKTRPAADLPSRDVQMEPEHVGLFESILADAVGVHASDIHLELYGERVRVRLRVDGVLHDVSRYQLKPQQVVGIINVLKTRARLDVAEHRRPQGGRLGARVGAHELDLLVQTQPSLDGEHAVVRLLPQDRDPFSIETLGFSDTLASHFRRMLRSPSGLVLVVGPTGCGKSTTLYAGIQDLARDSRRKVITVEDPIEYEIEGVQQTQVNPDVDFGFANAVRSFVRQDPDVILVGEIRDAETALEALRASQTGHLVLATLHSNDAVGAVQRLYDLGLHPNSIAAELGAVFAQRLARRICPACRVPATPPQELFDEVFPEGKPASFRAFGGSGCERCRGRGGMGRIAIGEYLPSTPELRMAISHGQALDELRATAVGAGLNPMRQHALQLAAAGTIAFEDFPTLFRLEHLPL